MTTQERPLLSDLTDLECVVQALDEYDQLGPEEFFERYHWFGADDKKHKFGSPRTWPLYYRRGKNPSHPYPSKAIAGVAYQKQHGQLLCGFSGGRDTVAKRLNDLDPHGDIFRFHNPYEPTTGQETLGGARRTRQYFSFFANPSVYRVEDAIQSRSQDLWVTKGRPLKPGDRVLIWRGKASDGERGVVGLGEVLDEPTETSDLDNPYWVDPANGENIEPRVNVQYLKLPDGPLWISEYPELQSLSVSRARGGTVFNVSAEEWRQVVDLAGGWHAETVDDIVEEILGTATTGGGGTSGQGYASSKEARDASERYAMQLAKSHYKRQGYTSIIDVGATESYDLICEKKDSVLHVEVKGTTSSLPRVFLTKNEVSHARAFPNVALFVVTDIAINAAFEASGGVPNEYNPWDIKEGILTPTLYTYLPCVNR